MKAKIWKVHQINAYLRKLIDGDLVLHSFFTEGEISNYRPHPSGHLYFTLKDEKASINCVLFKTYGESVTFDIMNGLKVVVCGYVSVYEKTGQVQLYAEYIEPAGKGRQYAALELLKEKLRQEGLFDEARKKPLPFYPRTVAVITSKSGAAVRDMIQVARRRNAGVKIVVYPVLVQGENAPAEIVSGIKNVNAWGGADVILLGRGGGSAEDLWAFNDEAVARAIAQSKIPIVSAVGHETDFTIADLAADMRAPTPSSAAEIAVPELSAMKHACNEIKTGMAESLRKKIESKRKTSAGLYQSLQKETARKFSDLKNRYRSDVKSLENISPLKVLSRGYVLAKDEKGAVVTDAVGVQTGDRLFCRFRDGEIVAEVTEKRVQTVYVEEKNGF
ncbi:MAG: exodeoxyribonuclease VII large subunit [Clostridiales bacterium]|jgi:exodeoxyribonuclease VII large subunit|nr:exodeoxyribonuclease VII large subunit [Clostridiales bacterium]